MVKNRSRESQEDDERNDHLINEQNIRMSRQNSTIITRRKGEKNFNCRFRKMKILRKDYTLTEEVAVSAELISTADQTSITFIFNYCKLDMNHGSTCII